MTVEQPGKDLEKLQGTIARLEKLLEISRTLNSNLNLDNLLLSIVHAARELTHSEDASILLLDKRTGALYFEATTNQQKDILSHVLVPLTDSIAGWIVTEGKPLVLNDAAQDPRHYDQATKKIDFVTKALLGVPLQVKGKTIGVLEVLNPKDNAEFTDEDIQTITVLATQAAVAIENARLFEQSDQIADIIHELRTPITAIFGFSKLLLIRDNIDAKTQVSFLETINREAAHLNEMIDKFLDLSRLETRRQRLEMTAINLNKVVEEAIRLLNPQTEKHSLQIDFILPQEPLKIQGDASYIKQVVVNLISNAVKYNRVGGQVYICVRHNQHQAEIIVSDTGLGIPEDRIDQIFNKFFRVLDHSDKATGTGLGLSIVKEIVEAHNGSIEVQSKLDEGSTFTVKLPLQQDQLKIGN